ncbi:hypothetical protein PILCRDRAFT_829395 [Piloderma croceum F 1598]|uniref:Transmembrane protein n=1 Tax=Piloderma croceum (strain F 1598) TaxID=765440 RepID=A0A0C3EYR7_PILCF|nr:hypothetical protein PILCRDRAFT_829395 [Piloderma croceum F 1598]
MSTRTIHPPYLPKPNTKFYNYSEAYPRSPSHPKISQSPKTHSEHVPIIYVTFFSAVVNTTFTYLFWSNSAITQPSANKQPASFWKIHMKLGCVALHRLSSNDLMLIDAG